MKKRPKERYYSLLFVSTEQGNPYSVVVRDGINDVLRISLCNMAIYECYLFALGLPHNYPKEQIIIYGDNRAKYRRCKVCPDHLLGYSTLYNYELTVPADTTEEEYRQQILNELNRHFHLEAKIEKLVIVKDSHKIITANGYSVELIWEDQLVMVMETKGRLLSRKFP
ncbi:hypothetical protein D3C80_1204680 [compost metagenome]